LPDYDRTTLHTSVAPPVEPFAAGLAAMLPPAEQAALASQPATISEPPPSSRGPMVIRVDVPSLSAATASIKPRAESTLPLADGQLSALARLGMAQPEPEREQLNGHASSVMPTASASASAPPVAGAPVVIKTPASMVPSSEGPEIQVGVLSMPHLRAEPARVTEDIVTPPPVMIPQQPLPTLDVTPTPSVVSAADAAHPDEGSGVRHVLPQNERGVAREVCSRVVYNACS
jgi:hypothetical protein